jgi:hypothetical protein
MSAAKAAEVGLSTTHPEIAITGDYPVHPCDYKLRPSDQSGCAYLIVNVDATWIAEQASPAWVYLRDADGLLAWWKIGHVARRGDTVRFSG